MNSKNNILSIIVFYVIAIGARYLTNQTDILADLDNHFIKIIIQGIGPTVGVIVTSLIFKIKFQPMTLTGNYNRAWFPILLYWLLPIILISATTFLTNGNFPISIVFACFLYGLFEEIGWRGFLQQQLKGLPRFWNVFLVGLLWFIWHLNFELSAANLLFLGLLIFGSWGIGIVADKTNSLLAVSAFHSLYNVKSENNSILLGVFLIGWILLLVFSQKAKKEPKASHSHGN